MLATTKETMAQTGRTETTTGTVVNGIDVETLRGAMDGITADPTQGQTHWTIRSAWRGGTRSDHRVDSFDIGGKTVDRKFTIRIDEPVELCGTNQFANPQEYLLAALNACMMVGYTAVSALMGVNLTRLEVTTEGDIDLRGFLGLDSTVKPGYESLRQTVRIAGDGTPEQFRKIHEMVKATSPNYFNVTTAIPLTSKLVVDEA